MAENVILEHLNITKPKFDFIIPQNRHGINLIKTVKRNSSLRWSFMAQRNNEKTKNLKIVRNKKKIVIIVWRIKKSEFSNEVKGKLVRKRRLFFDRERESWA